MEMYNVYEHGNAEAYLIQGTESNPRLTNPPLEQLDIMYNQGAPEFVVEQGLYYPTATNYGYICTGLESPGDWDDHHSIFSLDGQEVQYAGAQTEGLPYVYYTPSYGYAHSPYNPYNPFIPGALMGVDGPFVGTQQYYSIPPYENPAPAYFPMVVQSGPEIMSSNTTEAFLDTGAFTTNRAGGPVLKNNLSAASATYTRTPPKPTPNQTRSFVRVSEGSKANAGPSKLPAAHGNVTSSSFSSMASSQVLQGRAAHTVDNIPHGKALSHRNQLKVALSSSNGLSTFGSSTYGRAAVEKIRPKFQNGSPAAAVNGGPDALIEQNRGPRTNKSKNHLAVKAYTTRAGETDAEGNIVIYTDLYNKDDFPLDYVNAKFFVIKSYSEDDVHKSIKYNVWSSTPNGNKKLQTAYEDAQRIGVGDPRCCPIFLFFSVNASGQFCGVAEMIGLVDFHKDMDFWQQDKWSGSFPVKWHIIKDVPNPNFRHIILENNENKPVTNSRDTQEIRYKQGIEMLKIFKNHSLKTSLLDDFMYYENRQKIMQEEKARLLIKSYGNSFLIPAFDPPRKQNFLLDMPCNEDEKTTKYNQLNILEKAVHCVTEQDSLDPNISSSRMTKENDKHIANKAKHDDVSSLPIGSLTINPKQAETKPLDVPPNVSTVVDAKLVDVVTVGSMPVRVNGFGDSSGFFTVGTIPVDPRALQMDKAGGAKNGSQL
ncbi:YTH domain-containing protein ECT4-like isoform X1 [Actinidia eriantha]|uniref:YTH domain-containing protein ECT4-like isoform X1 n=2 Tax=Actinidia eriantha TaxID=165200 RepID=UPI002585C9FC|nr:YTH domain-containing protein ECT4-like isoform X1 [Actinidia eriantha]XP_057485234.1 YTH domain-containing protein ECT4-like isoform X1 [Actinidia eriantha]XP_057485235.1 YTH domain-containing protein ECT4-like isoform X1 [Actinidia eriantha]